MSEQKEPSRRRRTPAERERDAAVERCKAAVAAKHSGEVECVFSFFMGMHEMFVTVWQDGRCIGNYAYIEEA